MTWCAPSDGTFEHQFSGYSVWLEPISSPPLQAAMIELASKCGGPACGVHLFAPHLTLLYNIHLNMDGKSDPCGCDSAPESRGNDLLRKCLQEYESLMSASDGAGGDDSQRMHRHKEHADVSSPGQIEIKATGYYYFPYPKSADEGRGFGCVISMLLMEKSRQLQALHDACRSVFPPDERHGEAGACFEPHLALVYAPEHCGGDLEMWTKHKASMEQKARASGDARGALVGAMKAKCISLWKTEGKIEEWHCIAALDLT